MLDWGITADRIGLRFGICLIEIEIEVVARRHDHVMPHASRLDTAILTSPRHHRRLGSQAALQDLIPADQLASLALQEILRLMNHVALQLVHRLHTHLAHQRLALRTAFPSLLARLVATDMHIFIGEKFDHLRQDILHEGK